MRVAVLGASGFVGQHVTRLLVEAGILVAGFSRSTGCDLLQDWHQVAEFRPTHIVNCAAETGSIAYVNEKAADVISTNMQLLINVFALAKEVGAILLTPIASCGYPGALDLYEEHRFWDGPVHETVLSFGSTRRMVQAFSDCYRRQYDLDARTLFVPNMYGPGDSADPAKTHALNALVVKFLRAVDAVELWGSGSPVREWLFVEDFARIVFDVITKDKRIYNVNIGQERGYSIKELADLIGEETDFTGTVTYDRSRPDGAPLKVMGRTQFDQWFPHFEFTPLQEGIRRTIESYRLTGIASGGQPAPTASSL